MSTQIIVGFRASHQSPITIEALKHAIKLANDGADDLDQFSDDRPYVALKLDTAQINGLITAPDGLLVTEALENIVPSAMAIDEVARRYLEDAFKQGVRQSKLNTRLKKTTVTKEAVTLKERRLFVMLDIQDLREMRATSVCQHLNRLVLQSEDTRDATISVEGLPIQVLSLTRQSLLSLHFLGGGSLAVNRWVEQRERKPLAGLGNSTKSLVNIAYLLASMGYADMALSELMADETTGEDDREAEEQKEVFAA